MHYNTPFIIDIPIAFNVQTSFRHQLRLVRYTAQLKSLLDTPPHICEHCPAEAIKEEIIDNYLWVMAELVNGLYQLKTTLNTNEINKEHGCLKQETYSQHEENKDDA